MKLCTKFTVPHGEHVFLAMKTAEAFLDSGAIWIKRT